MYNLLGFLPAPFVYGAIADSGPGEGQNARLAMGTLMFAPVVSVVSFVLATFLIFRDDVLDFKGQAIEMKKQAELKDKEMKAAV